MSDLAYQRFMASYMLNAEESLPQNRQEIIDLTEEILDAKGIECDNKIKELPEEKIKEILEEVRKFREKIKKKKKQAQEELEAGEAEAEEQEQVIVASNNS
jgi:ElaB/YqjD/DUF883 family membrane-anchored ribosome-binding protein